MKEISFKLTSVPIEIYGTNLKGHSPTRITQRQFVDMLRVLQIELLRRSASQSAKYDGVYINDEGIVVAWEEMGGPHSWIDKKELRGATQEEKDLDAACKLLIKKLQ